MFYSALAVIAAILCLIIAYSGAKLLFRNSWILGWLRGMFGLSLLAMALIFAFVAFDIFTYRQIVKEQVIATISFEKLAEQEFKVMLANSDGLEKTYTLRGDQWQLDARIIKWKGEVAKLGIQPGYRLDRISGRYFSLEDERNAERTLYSFNESHLGVDVWQWLRQIKNTLPVVDAVYGSATYLPMADGALFEVSLSGTGLVTRPLNEIAQDAVGLWQ
ncbi:cation/multidrug efflux pump [Gilvimarinus agarilyticus]|uniref:cation/multidrug efflux pump n=1 Tax=unclassified Gilvimarinus TaxID=2642066 RepID=UPI001C0A08DD|nr:MULTISPECIES: cation/multidrug efflux pump [unclassified Gilvimarinus]MBU2887081.1 cation/multidrug efflux pump [Gilvimarinus agarilyticus]MDO6571740.1 cation/multidrug efflux pump [Gilvimarinus sp. 2_MG-2023]MDO6745812.1 cation/multidrug efflux pump [Gilvimarinus sp. 1_MG-2023]